MGQDLIWIRSEHFCLINASLFRSVPATPHSQRNFSQFRPFILSYLHPLESAVKSLFFWASLPSTLLATLLALNSAKRSECWCGWAPLFFSSEFVLWPTFPAASFFPVQPCFSDSLSQITHFSGPTPPDLAPSSAGFAPLTASWSLVLFTSATSRKKQVVCYLFYSPRHSHKTEALSSALRNFCSQALQFVQRSRSLWSRTSTLYVSSYCAPKSPLQVACPRSSQSPALLLKLGLFL